MRIDHPLGSVESASPTNVNASCYPPIALPQSPYQQMIRFLMQIIQQLLSALLGQRRNRHAQAAPEQGQAAGGATPAPGTKLENIGGREAVRVDGFLWKPISDGGNKKLVVLLPKDVTANAQSCVIKDASGTVVGRADQNGDFNGRGIFRFAKEGGEYPHNCTVEVQLKDGTVKRYPIGDTSLRHD